MATTSVFTTSQELIAPCGIDCRFCKAYARKKDPCFGCRDDSIPKPVTRVRCLIKTCEKLAGGTDYCIDCDEFPCVRLSRLDARYRKRYSLSVIDNLVSIREVGIRGFIEAENQKWTCLQCSGMLFMHQSQCPSCGYIWHE